MISSHMILEDDINTDDWSLNTDQIQEVEENQPHNMNVNQY